MGYSSSHSRYSFPVWWLWRRRRMGWCLLEQLTWWNMAFRQHENTNSGSFFYSVSWLSIPESSISPLICFFLYSLSGIAGLQNFHPRPTGLNQFPVSGFNVAQSQLFCSISVDLIISVHQHTNIFIGTEKKSDKFCNLKQWINTVHTLYIGFCLCEAALQWAWTGQQ